MKFSLALISTIFLAMSLTSGIKATEPSPKNSAERVIALNETISWSEYNSDSGQFLVKFPGQPEQKTSNIPIADIESQWNISTVKNGTELYTVAYTDLTTHIIKLGADTVIDSIKNTLETNFSWAALNGRGKEITVGEYPAREIIGTQDNKISIVRLILADKRLYAVIVTSENLNQIEQFLDSFSVQPWQPYISETGRFKVNLPTAPGEEKDTSEFAGKLFEWNLIEARNFTNPNDAYSVGYTDISPEDLKDGPDAFLNEVGKNILAKLSGQKIIEDGREISINGNPGR